MVVSVCLLGDRAGERRGRSALGLRETRETGGGLERRRQVILKNGENPIVGLQLRRYLEPRERKVMRGKKMGEGLQRLPR